MAIVATDPDERDSYHRCRSPAHRELGAVVQCPQRPRDKSRIRRCPSCALRSRRTWARLIKKVYKADPLLCRRCSRPLNVASLIDGPSVIERILRHLKLRDRPERPPPIPGPGALHYDVEIPAWQDGLEWLDGSE
jgi:hypothetical protein